MFFAKSAGLSAALPVVVITNTIRWIVFVKPPRSARADTQFAHGASERNGLVVRELKNKLYQGSLFEGAGMTKS